jgi:uncharacterized protein
MITLINSDYAKVGYEFIFYGGADECEKCELNKACLGNLEKGSRYRVTILREMEHPCKINEKVRVVEVEETEIFGVIETRKAFAGSSIIFTPVECENIFCTNYKYCLPEGLIKGEKYEIRETLNKLECERKKPYTRVRFRRVG